MVEVNARMQPGHLALPNGLGLDYPNDDYASEAHPNDGYPDRRGGAVERTGAAPNTLTSLDDRDRFVGTPWHKSVPARVAAI